MFLQQSISVEEHIPNSQSIPVMPQEDIVLHMNQDNINSRAGESEEVKSGGVETIFPTLEKLNLPDTQSSPPDEVSEEISLLESLSASDATDLLT